MIRFILVATTVVMFLIVSIPLVLVECLIGKKNRHLRDVQCLGVVKGIFRFILWISGVDITVKGKENIPTDTAVLYVGNHRSYFDILVGYVMVPSLTGFVAKKEMEKIPLLSTWMRLVNCLFLDRENLKEGLKTILKGIDQVKHGVSVWIFPEGTRNEHEDLMDMLPFKEGSLKIAEKSGCPVVPVAIIGTAEIFEKHFPKIRPSHVIIEFGKPFFTKELEPEFKKFPGAYTENRIKEMLAPIKPVRAFDLQEIRKQLDVIDGKMVSLFEERMLLCGEVAESKLGSGKPVYDGERERQKLESVTAMVHGEFQKQATEELFSQMMTISRRYQYKLLAEHGITAEHGFQAVEKLPMEQVRVVYQGVEGAYSHGAALQYFGEDVDAYHVPSWEDAMEEVAKGLADYAVLPIENSSAGAVSDNYDLLVKYHNYIVAETCLSVNHALLGLQEANLEDIDTVFSHPQALMQCSQYLNSHRNWKQISVENTAVAAKRIIELGDVSQAAVASEIAGKLYGLKVLQSVINHNKDNTTRFIILSREPVYRNDAQKVSLCFELPHKSGSLYNMLSNFIYNRVNMMMIESRPILGRNWEYRFFVDLEGNLSEAPIQNALKGISEEAVNMRILGNY